MTMVKKKEAFLHVIDSHRWLAASGYVWNMVGPSGPQKGAFDKDLPNIDVMALDSLLLHARSLINFYTNHIVRRKNSTDITLSVFAIPEQLGIEARIGCYRQAIDRHLLHLTATGMLASGRTPQTKRRIARTGIRRHQ